MEEESGKLAPTMSIETLIVVRPIKVMALLLGLIDVILMILCIGVSSWAVVEGQYRQGLWEICHDDGPGRVDCEMLDAPIWLMACRGMVILTIIMLMLGNIINSKGLNAPKFSARYRCYYIAMLLYFLGVLFISTALIIFPVKYSEDYGEKAGVTWSFGWAYCVGWVAAGLMVVSALLLCIDKDSDEIIFREKEHVKEGIEEEEEELLTGMDKSETESDLAYADGYLKC